MMFLFVFGISSMIFPLALEILKHGRANILDRASADILRLLKIHNTSWEERYTQGNMQYIKRTEISYKLIQATTLVVVAAISLGFVTGLITLGIFIGRLFV